MRSSIVDFARLAKPLNEKLVLATTGKKKTKRVANGVKIAMSDEDRSHFDALKFAIIKSVTLSFPVPGAKICMFTDASDLGWGIIITQVIQWDKKKLAHEQEHQMLHCQSGTFNGAQLNWSIVEKECYPVAKACSTLDHLLMRPDGFTVYCDHRNLVHMFAPAQDVKKHIRGKLLRWGLQLQQYRYNLEHVPGDTNVVADMFSRWGGPVTVQSKNVTGKAKPATVESKPVTAVSKNVTAVSKNVTAVQLSNLQNRQLRKHMKRFTRQNNRDHQQSKDKVKFMSNARVDLDPLDSITWPSVEDIQTAQDQEFKDRPAGMTRGEQNLWMDGDRVWIPPNAHELMVRLMIIAHNGHMGHRGHATTKNVINTIFVSRGLDAKLKIFLDACLLCPHVKGGRVIPRPWSSGIQTNVPNLYLHMDYLFIGDSVDGNRYILVLKDAASHFVHLVSCQTANAETTAHAIMEWCALHGTPKYMVSDQGTHFKNETLEIMSALMKVEQQFIVAYSPWKNGTVERVNRDVLQLLRVMLLEFGWNHNQWPALIELITHNMNHSQVASLANHAPIEVFTSRKPDNPLQTIVDPDGKCREVVYTNTINERLQEARESLTAIHKAVENVNVRQQLLNMEQQRVAQETNFDIGDYVLRSRVDDKTVPDKLDVTWVGPYMVVEAHARQSFTVQQLITKKKRRVHASRLKFYHDASLNISEKWLGHVSRQNEPLTIEELKDIRWNREVKDYQVFVKWDGLDEVENSWEPMKKLFKDIPKMLETYCEDKSADIKNIWPSCSIRMSNPLRPQEASVIGQMF